MKADKSTDPASPANSNPLPWPWVVIIGCLVILLVGVLWPTRRRESPDAAKATNGGLGAQAEGERTTAGLRRVISARASPPQAAAEEVVAGKLVQFAQSRRELAHALGRRHGVQVSKDVERFFDAVASGNWEEIEKRFKVINGGDSSAGHADGRSPGVEQLWPAIIDAYGAAEQVHLWPAQQLLNYGTAILDSLRRGMVYVGGTDNGRWIPELLNDTTDGQQHVMVTQNALADATYVDYLSLLYGERMNALTPEDSQRAFAEYMADAQKRLEHDQQFPDEPKQVRPGEDIRITEGKTQVSGQVAVMAINERLLQTLMQKNPEMPFAIEESFPLKGTYADALPLGPLMELRARGEENAFTPERAAQSLDYLRDTAQSVLADPEASGSETALRSYSHDTVAAAHLLAAHNFNTEAEEAYRLAAQLWPGNLESVAGLVDVLARSGRMEEARKLFDDFTRAYPQERPATDPSLFSVTKSTK